MSTTQEINRATLIGTFAVILWGAIAVIVKLISRDVGAFYSAAILHGVVGSLGFAFFAVRRELPNPKLLRNRWFLGLRALLFPINVIAFCTGISLVSPDYLPFALLINYLWPTLTLVFTILLLRSPIPRPLFFLSGILVVLLSLAWELLSGLTISPEMFASQSDRISYGCMLIAATTWPMYGALTRKYSSLHGGGSVVPFFSLITAVTAFTLGWFGLDPKPPATITFHPVFLLGGVVSFVALFCWDHGTRKGNITVLSLCADALPWISIGVVHLVIGSPLHWHTLASAIMLVLGALITRYGTLAPKQPTS